jgi:flavodoxin
MENSSPSSSKLGSHKVLFISFILAFILIGSLASFSQNWVKTYGRKNEKTLIVYLSRTKNTQALAEMIQQEFGGELLELELEKPYPEDYQAIVAQVARENETGYLPPLKTKVDISKYEVIFLGFPTWGMQLPPPIKTFLHENDLKGKTIIPFNTNAGYGVGSGFQEVELLCKNSHVLPGLSVKGGLERDGILFVMHGEKKREVLLAVKEWLDKTAQALVKIKTE